MLLFQGWFTPLGLMLIRVLKVLFHVSDKLKNEIQSFIIRFCFYLKKKSKIQIFDCNPNNWKGHSIFVLKWNRILIFFFVFRFHYQIEKWLSNPNFNFQLKWKNEFLLVFLRSFFCAETLLWSVTSPKLPVKMNLFFHFRLFKKWKLKIKFWTLLKWNFKIQMQFLNFVFLFNCQVEF